MDPDMTLRHLREMVALWQDGHVGGNVSNLRAHLDAITSAFENLDGWLNHEGFLPTDWER
jgi:hypothetical protein